MIKRSHKCVSVLIIALLMVSPILCSLIHAAAAESVNLEPLGAFYTGMKGEGCAYLDTVDTYDGNPSIHCVYNSLNPNDPDGYTEIDGAWISVSPGDHVYASCWIKTGSLPTATDPSAGAAFGFDFYAHTNVGYGIIGPSANQQASHPDAAELYWGQVNAFGRTINGENGLTQVSGQVCRVPYGQDWTLCQWDFIVPSTYYSNVWVNPSVANAGSSSKCNSVQIDSMVFWMGGRDVGDKFFADPIAYINPSGNYQTSSATPYSTSSPTPTPTPPTSSTSNVVATNIALAPSYTAHGQSFVESGFALPINVTVQNKEDFSELASVELFANSTSLYKGTLSLNSFSSGILNCSLDTSNLSIGNYTITASVVPLAEPNSAPSTVTAGTVGITYNDDLNGGFQVNTMDLLTFVAEFITCGAHGAYNPAIDFNHDGKIDAADFFVFIANYIDYWTHSTEVANFRKI